MGLVAQAVPRRYLQPSRVEVNFFSVRQVLHVKTRAKLLDHVGAVDLRPGPCVNSPRDRGVDSCAYIAAGEELGAVTLEVNALQASQRPADSEIAAPIGSR